MIPAHFFAGTTFTHSSRFRPASMKPGGQCRGRVAGLFLDGTTFPHSFPARPAPREPGDQARRDALHFFSREPVFLIPSGWDRCPGSQEIGLAGMHCTIFQGNHFSSFPLFHGRRWPHQTFSSSSSSSSSPQRDSGILAVRKTGASVLRLVPPTS